MVMYRFCNPANSVRFWEWALATIDTTEQILHEHRLAMIQERGFEIDDAMLLVHATKLVSSKSANGEVYFYEVPITWHDIAKLQDAGATNAQILRILG